MTYNMIHLVTLDKQDLKHHCELTSYSWESSDSQSFKINHIFLVESYSNKDADVIFFITKLKTFFSSFSSKGPGFWTKLNAMLAILEVQEA